MVEKMPSTTSTLEWIIVGWYSKILTPPCRSGPKSWREAMRTGGTSMCGPGTITLTSTPRLAAADERGADLLVGEEVGVLDVDALRRRLDRHEVEHLRER